MSGWPFGDDADREDPLTAHRIAVTSSHPTWAFLVAFDRESAARPTSQETELLVSFLDEYKNRWYQGSQGEWYVQRMAGRPLDVDGDANGVVFRKWGKDDWGIRRRSWVRGALYQPQSPQIRESCPEDAPLGPFSLVQLMDWEHSPGRDEPPTRRWLDWKAAHPEVFGG